MHVTMRQLQVFEAVARHLSFTRAAEELHLTQPAVSMQIKQLESMVELPLFEQIGKKVFLARAGEIMLEHSRTILDQLKEAAEEMESLKGVEGGHLVVCIASTVNYFATRLLSVFFQQHPNVRLSLDVTNRKELLKRLEANEPDLVLMGKPPRDLDVEAEAFMDNPLIIIAPPNHPLRGKRKIPLRKMEQETFVMRESGSGTRIAMERMFEQHGIRPPISVQLTGNEAIKQSVEAGLGLAVVSIHTVELELGAGRLISLDVEHFPIERKWYIAHRKGKRLSATAKAFREFVLQQSDSMA